MYAGLNPDPEQARQWLAEELARDEYHDGRSLLERVLRWFSEQIERLQSSTEVEAGFGLPPLVLALVAAVVFAGVAWALTRVRAERHAATESARGVGPLTLTAPHYRDRAEAALREGRYDDAVVDYTRAIAKDASDRTLLTDSPSLTAHEIGARLAAAFPAAGPAIRRTMDLFDAVRYGRISATRADAEHARDCCETLREARPLLEPASVPTEVERRPVADEFEAHR